MKIYDITKIDTKTEKEVNYGTMCEEDMKLVTRGYKQDKDIASIYSRVGSRYFFIVNQVREIL